jgi:phosphatidylserine/phosphatidylglycerophosphate/cardiolipin synthase-like enzyme
MLLMQLAFLIFNMSKSVNILYMTNEVLIGKQFSPRVIELINNAKFSIKTVVYDWRWYANDPGNAVQLFNQAIIRATKRGVKVEAIVNNDGIVNILNENGVAAKKISVPGIMHAKLMLIDDEIAIIGSHNYTHNAFVVNSEISTVLTLPDNFSDFNNFFKTLWQ